MSEQSTRQKEAALSEDELGAELEAAEQLAEELEVEAQAPSEAMTASSETSARIDVYDIRDLVIFPPRLVCRRPLWFYAYSGDVSGEAKGEVTLLVNIGRRAIDNIAFNGHREKVSKLTGSAPVKRYERKGGRSR